MKINAWIENGDPHQYKKLLDQYKIEKEAFDKKHKQKKQECGIEGLERFDISELIEMPFPPSRVSFNEDGISLHVYGEYNCYPISWCDIRNTKKDIFGWIETLCEKQWCDTELISDFLACVCSHFKMPIPQSYD